MQSKIPVYPYNAKDAMKRGEIEKWRESFRENCACAGGIDILIRENFDGMHLKDGTVSAPRRARPAAILAMNTLTTPTRTVTANATIAARLSR